MKKLRNIIICLVFATIRNSFGQAASGKVVYKIQLAGFGSQNASPENKELNETIVSIANSKTATLTFNSKRSSFVLDNYLSSDSKQNGLTGMAEKLAFIEINGQNYFIDKVSNSSILENMDGFLIEKENEKLEWEITTESKEIDGYLCYKAIHLWKFTNRRGTATTIPIIAWFAPSLPYSYGPKYFTGLPGLILELTDRKITFLASSISILKNQQLEVEFPKGKTVNSEDYNKKILSK
ncbi:GLPGLI family protein [Flavobacterium sp. 14A]|uniref:GLPGLI family protein n=1 Tax=Flavobacterium sp. 14A TaxID=2735896 RepID=UPI00156EC6AB|nr:GLPGLI family protein [Flavobacterium sp. 14A]NRT11655.1 GLPGLI family protein [Flavobacterium sp. 14A]